MYEFAMIGLAQGKKISWMENGCFDSCSLLFDVHFVEGKGYLVLRQAIGAALGS